MKKCKCEEYLTCNSDQSCMYDFISVKHVAELGTLIIEDLSCDEKVVVCDEHIPQLIEELKTYNSEGNLDEEQWLVTYDYNNEVVRCLFSNEQDAINYNHYINTIFLDNVKTNILKVRVLPCN